MADEIKTCRELDEQLAPYVDGEEPPAARRAVEAHLAGLPAVPRAAPATSAPARDVVARAPRRAARRARRSRSRAAWRLPHPRKARRSASAEASAGQAALARSADGVEPDPPMGAAVARRDARCSPSPACSSSGSNDRVEALAASLALDHVKCFKVEWRTRAQRRRSSRRATGSMTRAGRSSSRRASRAQQLTLVDAGAASRPTAASAHMMYTWRGAPLSLYVLPEDTSGAIGRIDKMGRAGRHLVRQPAHSTRSSPAGHPQDLSGHRYMGTRDDASTRGKRSMKSRWIIAAGRGAARWRLLTLPLLRGRTGGEGDSGGRPPRDSRGAPSCDARGHGEVRLRPEGSAQRPREDGGLQGQGRARSTSGRRGAVPARSRSPPSSSSTTQYKDKGSSSSASRSTTRPSSCRPFMEEYKMNYPVLQMTPDVENAYGPFYGYPTSFIVARDGIDLPQASRAGDEGAVREGDQGAAVV